MANNNKNTPLSGFGGDWTEVKLDILEKYLNFYTTALKKQGFELWYIDAFAGYGEIKINNNEVKKFIDGSVTRALNVKDKPFDKLFFVDKSKRKIESLERIKHENSNRDICIINCDANKFLGKLDDYLHSPKTRGVLFLDPFGAQVEWST